MRAQPVAAGPSKQYGERAAQERSQRQLPLAGGAAIPSGPEGGPPSAPGPEGPFPGELGGLADATNRPGEPITTGLPVGAGAGPEALGMNPGENVKAELRALFRANPIPELADLIAEADG